MNKKENFAVRARLWLQAKIKERAYLIKQGIGSTYCKKDLTDLQFFMATPLKSETMYAKMFLAHETKIKNILVSNKSLEPQLKMLSNFIEESRQILSFNKPTFKL